MKQFAVIGLGRFGQSLAKTLYRLGNDVLAIDRNEDRVQDISNEVTHAVQADALDEASLKSLGLRNFDVVVITIGNDIQASILVTVICKELEVPMIVAKAQNDLHAKVLLKIGADKVVFPERDMGIRVANMLSSSSILDYIEISPDYNLVEIGVLPSWVGKTLQELNMRIKYGINVMAIRSGKAINVSPHGDDMIQEGDVVVAIGSTEDINKIEKAASALKESKKRM